MLTWQLIAPVQRSLRSFITEVQQWMSRGLLSHTGKDSTGLTSAAGVTASWSRFRWKSRARSASLCTKLWLCQNCNWL